ncbi:IclR family transcriptional regulator [Microbacterium sp. SS28]|uniref:IclR family transcriptional regulator n=1 Tax=Microbacterium sp. SS28 TaxID=2919948 RepID=UPI001FA9A3BB|nr:IclR family transcriptional regulator [Microbacterium sp. SS28]
MSRSESLRDVVPPDEKLVGADRVIAVLTELADHPLGVTLDELAGKLQSSKPTVHRALATLRRAGLADMTGRGVYILGDEYLRLAFRNLDGRPETARIQPLLEDLATHLGETAHYAVLSGKDIVYRAKMDPPQGAVRLTSVIGGRNPAYRTAVGKALLSSRLLNIKDVREWFGAFPLEQKTPHTLITPEALLAEFEATRARGFAIDDQENEVGINCVAVSIYLDGSATPAGAISVSAVRFRTPLESLVDAVPAIRETIGQRLGANALR